MEIAEKVKKYYGRCERHNPGKLDDLRWDWHWSHGRPNLEEIERRIAKVKLHTIRTGKHTYYVIDFN